MRLVMKITRPKFLALLVATILFIGCHVNEPKNVQSKVGKSASIDPNEFIVYEGFGVEGYFGKMDNTHLTKEEASIQQNALDFWFEIGNLLASSTFIDIYANQGAKPYQDSICAYFEGKHKHEPEEYDYYWRKRYTAKGKKQILSEMPCNVETPVKCKDRNGYYNLPLEDQQKCNEWRKEMTRCRDVWFHCPEARYFDIQKPVITGNEAKVELQLYEGDYEKNLEAKTLVPCSRIQLSFVNAGEDWLFDGREIMH
jgi:hypothetical protein